MPRYSGIKYIKTSIRRSVIPRFKWKTHLSQAAVANVCVLPITEAQRLSANPVQHLP